VRRGVWMSILLLLSAIICVSVIPPTDLPETAYDETDTPVNQAPPVALGIRFVRPAKVTIVVPRKIVQAIRNNHAPVGERMPVWFALQQDSHSLQDFLCALLI